MGLNLSWGVFVQRSSPDHIKRIDRGRGCWQIPKSPGSPKPFLLRMHSPWMYACSLTVVFLPLSEGCFPHASRCGFVPSQDSMIMLHLAENFGSTS